MSVDANALERETLERKDRDELQKIAGALGGKVTSRTRKADIIDMILELTGVTSRPSEEPAAEASAEKADDDAGAGKGDKTGDAADDDATGDKAAAGDDVQGLVARAELRLASGDLPGAVKALEARSASCSRSSDCRSATSFSRRSVTSTWMPATPLGSPCSSKWKPPDTASE